MDNKKKDSYFEDDFIVVDEDSDDYEEYDDEDEIENFDDGENCAENSKNKIVATEVSNNTTLLKIDKFFKELRLVETERWDDICEEYHTLKHYVINADLFYNGDISIDLDARLIVYGDICAKNIFINSCIEVTGNVKATYIEAKTSVKISGNVNALDFKADSFDVYNFDYYDIEIGGNLNLSGYIYADNITVGGYIKVYGIIVYNDVMAKGSISVDTSISALGDVVSSDDIISEEDIIANGKIHAGEEIITKGQIKSGGSISAGWNIKADKNICANEYISSNGNIKSGEGILAGEYITAKGFIRCEKRIFAGISCTKTSDMCNKTIRCSNLRNGEVCYGELIETNNNDKNTTVSTKKAISKDFSVLEAERLITNIGVVSLDSKEDIALAYTAYNKLNERQKVGLVNSATLYTSDNIFANLVLSKIISEEHLPIYEAYSFVQGIKTQNTELLKMISFISDLMDCNGMYYQKGIYRDYFANITMFLQNGEAWFDIDYTCYDGDIQRDKILLDGKDGFTFKAFALGQRPTHIINTHYFTIRFSKSELQIKWALNSIHDPILESCTLTRTKS